ncbi:SpaA isopeptide-forming pilin-related protein [Zhihengliuella halotolerans]|nr:SpaA isopeptide-forming pilin-related protein [Zhihengliuella halotolerans]
MGLAAGLMFSGSIAMAAADEEIFPAAEDQSVTTEENTNEELESSSAEEPVLEEEPAGEDESAEEPAVEVAPVDESAAEEEQAEVPAAEEKAAPKQEPAAEAPAVEEEAPEVLSAEVFTPFASSSDFLLNWPADIDMATDPIGNADTTVYSNGSKENDLSSWNYNESAGSPGSGDVGDTWVAADYVGDDAWLWLAFERVTSNGQIGYFLELNQLASTTNANGADIPVRSVGDLRFVFPANNDAFSTPEVQVWDGSGWVTTTLPAGSWDHVVSQDETLVEFKFNLSAIFGGDDGMLECGDFDFANIMLRSAASASQQSELKDFVGGQIDLDLCSSLKILKTDENGVPLGGASFEIDPNPLPGGEGTLTVTDNDANDADPADGTIELAEVNPGEYTVTEVVAPDGYLLPADRDQGPLTVEPGGSVTFTFEDPIAWEPLSVEKSIEASYQVDYTWGIDKSVDQTLIEQAGTTADFTYLVEVFEGDRTATDFVAGGMITVDNPNAGSMVATVEDVLGDGTVCVIDAADASGADGHQIAFGPGETVLDYECEIGAEPESESGSNAVTLTWSNADYPQEQSHVDDPDNAGEASATDTVDFTWTTTEANEAVTVEDSQFTFDPEWSITWGSEEDGVYENTYTITREVPAGECQTFDNTVTIVETGQSDTVEATLCVGADLVVEKNVIHSFDRTYLWDIEKTVLGDQPFEADPETGDVTVEYEVTVGPNSFQDSGWAMSGEITVANPNDWQDIETTVSDAVDIGGGAECAVMDATRLIGAGESQTFDYNCTFTSEPEYEGENVATAVWDADAASTPTGEATGTAEVAADEWSVTPINDTVLVEDDHFTFDPAWEVTWSDGMEPEKRTYELTWNVGEAGTCAEFVNVASVVGDEGLTLAEDDALAEACREAPLVVEKTIDGSFDRTYLWDVVKERAEGVDEFVDADENGEATVPYLISVSSEGYADDGFELGGTISIENPNMFESGWIVAEVEDTISVESLVCTVEDEDLNEDGTVTIAPNSTVELDYSCTTEGATAETTGNNTAVVTWHEGERSASSSPVEFAFELDAETDETVEVFDDEAVPGSEGELLGTVSWDEVDPEDASWSKEFEQELVFTVESGTCESFTNTAWVVVTGENPMDDADVTVCHEADLLVSKTADASFDRLYLWEIAKEVDRSKVTVAHDGAAPEFEYLVSATPGGVEDSGWMLSGEITVMNPNSEEQGPIEATVADVPGVEGIESCVIEGGGDVVIDPGATVTLAYECLIEGQPEYEGENVVEVAWDGGSVTASTAVVFELDAETDKSVEVVDDQTDPGAEPVVLGSADWNAEGESTEFEYVLTHDAKAGQCASFTNTAMIVETGADAQAEVEACREAAPVPTPTPGPLPKTGAQAGWLALVGLGLLMAGAGALIARNRRDA